MQVREAEALNYRNKSKMADCEQKSSIIKNNCGPDAQDFPAVPEIS